MNLLNIIRRSEGELPYSLDDILCIQNVGFVIASRHILWDVTDEVYMVLEKADGGWAVTLQNEERVTRLGTMESLLDEYRFLIASVKLAICSLYAAKRE